jgi:hypothetical protein
MKEEKRGLVFRSALGLAARWLTVVPVLALIASCTPEPAADNGGTNAGAEQAVIDAASSCSHSICTSGTKLTSGCDPCVTKICASDPYCCNTKWSSLCVKEVASICGESCTGPTPDMSVPPTPDMGGHGPPPDMGGGGPGTGIGPNGGTVDHVYFAVVGDTRPANIDDTANYPTAIIEKIYSDIEGMSARPQFVVGTGDYQYASTTGGQNATQLNLYATAAKQYTGTVFAAMGNHECDGYTADNCTSATANFTAYMNAMVTPLGKTLPYYNVPIKATDGSWTAKLLIVACNYWNSTQQSWLTTQLSQSTTYTFVVRHEPASANTGPCVSEVESLLSAHPYNLSIVGHTHHYAASGKEVIVGNGGAPLSGGTYGYVTVEQKSTGFVVTNYDYSTGAAVSSTTVPF